MLLKNKLKKRKPILSEKKAEPEDIRVDITQLSKCAMKNCTKIVK